MMIGLGVTLAIVGTGIAVGGLFLNPFVAANTPSGAVYNYGLAQTRELAVYGGLILFGTGVLLAGLGSLRGRLDRIAEEIARSRPPPPRSTPDTTPSVSFTPPRPREYIPLSEGDAIVHEVYGRGRVRIVRAHTVSVAFDGGQVVEVPRNEVRYAGLN